MQIVIDIPYGLKDVYEHGNVTALDVEEMKMALRNGTVLPKHGRLIDADALIKEYGKYDIGVFVNKADTILEATKGNI